MGFRIVDFYAQEFDPPLPTSSLQATESCNIILPTEQKEILGYLSLKMANYICAEWTQL